ncbi:hypothetical protein SPRG_11144 [Saprolegnia parasitica CBS 223.65]|uniref:Uncharacterized protein n=1 Tax=Saprolegnia parasitica (strain CBS 223.65) TaxID=695850 RepID=A0A067C8V4_SAPPC|nr:hypothetical protein SPRG_11144 [Saprolegnia parasitica CBS 223.65]KDO23212.1 hypothetical protein SPRG_11144 [Saprolegnia parasitica CBS 223.65]|eukprot:XP_012206012.1 hypothetical protein SPRG_11144 [Saprolegnia parasitica CBS 223.65]
MEYTVRMPMLPIDDRLPGKMPPDGTIWSSIDDAWMSMAIWMLMVFQSTKNESVETMRSHLHRAKHLYENAVLDSLESCRLLGPLLQHAVHSDDDVKQATSSSLLLCALDEATSLTRLDTVLKHLLATLQLERGRRQLSMAQRRTTAKNAVVALSATAVISRVETAPMAATCGVLLSASVGASHLLARWRHASVREKLNKQIEKTRALLKTLPRHITALEAALEGAIHAVQTEMRLLSDLRVSAQLTRHWLLISSSLLFDIQAMTLEQQCRHVLARFAKGDD